MTRFIDDDERIVTLHRRRPIAVAAAFFRAAGNAAAEPGRRRAGHDARSACNCPRMRPELIIVGEVRGQEAFDLLQAMNTGHRRFDGHAPCQYAARSLSRLEAMITMGGYALPSRTIREMICAAVDVVVQAARLRDGSRRITHITEVMGMEGDVIITPGPLQLRNPRRRCQWQSDPGSTSRAASAVRNSGSVRAITAKTPGSPPRSVTAEAVADQVRG